MLKLRDYQEKALDAVWSEIKQTNTALCVLPTGGGKTELFMALIDKCWNLRPTVKVVIILNKVSLLDQTARRLRKALPKLSVSIFSGSRNKKELDGNVIVATIQSIDKVKVEGLNLLIVDECHNIGGDDGRYAKFIELNKHEKLKIIGFTATPFRASDGYIFGEEKLFKRMCFKLGMGELIDRGFLVKPVMKKPDEQFNLEGVKIKMGDFDQKQLGQLVNDPDKILRQCKDAISRLGDRKKVVWACVNIEHAENIFEALRTIGERPAIIHSKMDDYDRELNIEYFEKGEARHLVFITIVSEGYDFPAIDAIVLMRPTRSPVLYVQTLGRGLRPFEGKKDCLVLDYGKVVESNGPVDDPKVRKKGEREKSASKKDGQLIMMKPCPKCRTYLKPSVKVCPECEHVFESAADKLQNKADQDAVVFGKAPKKLYVNSVDYIIVSDHISKKSGKKCLRISYNWFLGSVDEYFRVDIDSAMKKFYTRLRELEIAPQLIQYPPDRNSVKISVQEKSVHWKQDGKYPEVSYVGTTHVHAEKLRVESPMR